jgi:hypothetical protein
MANIVFIVLGLLGLLLAYSGWKHPERALKGKYSIYVKLLGEKNALALARYIGAPLSALFGLGFLFLGIVGK